MDYYRQCTLERPTENGCEKIVSYIPDKFAKVGATVKLKEENDEWSTGWIVKTASPAKVEEKLLPDSHRDAKAHRRATGDALPKKTNERII
jgi:hypothetical protein